MIRTGIVLTAIVASVAVAGCGSKASTVSAPSTANARPTSSAPATSAACPPLSVGEDGTVSPLTCGGGDNPAAVSYYEGENSRGFKPKVLTLGAGATKAQVTSAICTDLEAGSKMGLQTETQAYQLAATAAGWAYDIKVVGFSC